MLKKTLRHWSLAVLELVVLVILWHFIGLGLFNVFCVSLVGIKILSSSGGSIPLIQLMGRWLEHSVFVIREAPADSLSVGVSAEVFDFSILVPSFELAVKPPVQEVSLRE